MPLGRLGYNGIKIPRFFMKRPNHLADFIEQKRSSHQLPTTLFAKANKLQELTYLAQNALTGIIPDEILADMWVVGKDQSLHLSFLHHTAASWARLMLRECITALQKVPQFADISTVKVHIHGKPTPKTYKPTKAFVRIDTHTAHNITQLAHQANTPIALKDALLDLVACMRTDKQRS